MKPFPGLEYLASLFFLLMAAATVAGALLAVLSTIIIRGVCGLALCCFGLAGLYYFLHSPFLALMEILIYVGAVCITIIFAVMLAEPEEAKEAESRANAWFWGGAALVVGVAIFWGLSNLSLTGAWPAEVTWQGKGTVEDIGKSLLTTYSMAFELISLAILVAILGALAVARGGRSRA